MSSMSHPPLADQHDAADEVILGVDTHKDVHVAAAVNINGVLLGSRRFPTTAEGYQALLNWAAALGPVRRAGIEVSCPLERCGVRTYFVDDLVGFGLTFRVRRGRCSRWYRRCGARIRSRENRSTPSRTHTHVSDRSQWI